MDVELDLIVENLWQGFTQAGIIKLYEPNVNLLQLGRNNVFTTLLWTNDMVDRRHDHGEHSDTKELHKHRIHVLKGSMAVDISISNRREGSNNPVNRSDIFCFH